MSYSTPPFYFTTAFNMTNVSTHTAILAAPGVGFCHRIVGVGYGFRRSVAAGVFGDMILEDGNAGSGIVLGAIETGGIRTVINPIPEPGLMLSENTGLFVNHIASAAGPFSVFLYVLSFIDQLN